MSERDPNWADEELRRELDALPSDIEEQREALYGDMGIPDRALNHPETEEYFGDLLEEDEREGEPFEEGDDRDYDPLEEPFDYGFGEDMED